MQRITPILPGPSCSCITQQEGKSLSVPSEGDGFPGTFSGEWIVRSKDLKNDLGEDVL